ncbi:flagellar biosynthetic protein FliR [Chromatocurvus halotolerans]|uniref:Flagellar biosynthetic protein FliR n=1 Tax=Chromatocurvus halotolerans TaxID=1132028 RepID=A0A4V2SBS5_9GAMM|nr:flagellar biosynthetic protein FliR [Chromatocurvus halotolerans]TCO76590.1 flagellar biosynthetic protein FliR [Chromatocurvus halotolerans]
MTPFAVDEAAVLEWLGQFLWALFRIAAMFMVVPLFGTRSVPVRIRMALALAFALALFPVLPDPPGVDLFSPSAVVLVLQQVMIGIAMGFIIQLVFDAIVIGIQTVSMSMGLGFAIFIDRQNGVQVPVLSQFHLIIAMLLFLSLDGHLMLVQLLAESFQIVPVDAGGFGAEAFWLVASWGSTLFLGALKVALPAATALLITNVAIGVVSRAAPTLNLFAIGLPMTMLVGFVVLFLTLPTLQQTLLFLLEEALVSIDRLLLLAS